MLLSQNIPPPLLLEISRLTSFSSLRLVRVIFHRLFDISRLFLTVTLFAVSNMPEIILYRNQYRESGPLLAAINRLGLQNFARSGNLSVTLIRLPSWLRYRKVTGFSGSYSAGRFNHKIHWTIHWDYDPIKGPHVNLLIQDNTINQTLRFAYCESH